MEIVNKMFDTIEIKLTDNNKSIVVLYSCEHLESLTKENIDDIVKKASFRLKEKLELI